jgi:hypothetical protein
METFNKYLFVSDLEAELLDAAKGEQLDDLDAVHDWIQQSVDNACIYYADCFDIIKALHFTDFTGSDFEITNVTQAAFAALYEHVHANIDLTEVEAEIEKLQNQD